jgi:hypothetical protein
MLQENESAYGNIVICYDRVKVIDGIVVYGDNGVLIYDTCDTA